MEIQDIIREEIPFFYRLSKSKTIGNNMLTTLCNEPITIREMEKYVLKYKPSYIMVFFEYNNLYTITEFNKKGYQYYNLNIEHKNIMSGSTSFGLLETNLSDFLWKNRKRELQYDILTYYDFYKKMRKECHSNIIQYFNSNINMSTLTDKIKTCLYLLSQYQLIMGIKNLDKELRSFQIKMMNHHSEDFDRYLNDIYNRYYPIIYDYISIYND